MTATLWCENGCQPMCGLEECGMCGYEGPGYPQDETMAIGSYHLQPQQEAEPVVGAKPRTWFGLRCAVQDYSEALRTAWPVLMDGFINAWQTFNGHLGWLQALRQEAEDHYDKQF